MQFSNYRYAQPPQHPSSIIKNLLPQEEFLPPTSNCDTGVNNAALNLHDPLPQQNENIRTTQERITMWKNITLHGRHACDLETLDSK